MVDDILKKTKRSFEGRFFLSNKEEVLANPDINEVQIRSFKEFLQEDVDPKDRKNVGLQFLFNSIFPFVAPNNTIVVEFSHYTIGDKKYSLKEAVYLDRSYTISIRATFRVVLKATGEIKEQEIFFCDMPYMTPNGTFVVNGIERTVVSQIHRSPGIIFDYNNRDGIYYSRIIPDRGCWLEFEIIKENIYVKVDRKTKIPLIIFLKALGYVDDGSEFIRLFCSTETVALTGKEDKDREKLVGAYLVQDILQKRKKVTKKSDKIKIALKAGALIDEENVKVILESEVSEIEIVSAEQSKNKEVLLHSALRDNLKDGEKIGQEGACHVLFYAIKGVEPSSNRVALNEIIGKKSIFFNSNLYSLGAVGRYKINKKFDYEDPQEDVVLQKRDIVNTIKYLLKVRSSESLIDDIDHLSNRRIRCVGEQLTNYLKIAFMRIEKNCNDKVAVQFPDTLIPENVISIKPVLVGIKEFFGTGELSQFMDQTNPLSAVTHKRRISALGVGGLTRERAGFEVRDIHYTHYGRICPIETPEGPNIGLIVSMSFFSKVNQYGFVESPYYKVKSGKILRDKIEYLSPIDEEKYKVAPFDKSLIDDKGNIVEEMIPVRTKGDYPVVKKEEVDYMDISPKQTISISAALIPFLEHDDANRALMGCNMMRQALPLLHADSPIVGTGVENLVAEKSGFARISDVDGVVTYVDNRKIVVETKEKKQEEYDLVKMFRSNQDTFYNQKPIVKLGDKVKKNQIISDGPAIQGGELALGKNIRVAFMSWKGYNYEDAVLMSTRLLKDDTYTSIHINEYEIEVRETKFGPEQITCDIPNVTPEELAHLDKEGVIHIGAEVKQGEILVGKVTPRGQTEISPEYKLLYSIFGKKVRDIKDTSLKAPHGASGVVIDVQRYSKENRDDIKPGVLEKIKIFIAKKRKLREGDKFAGRHGNKGVVARILPEEDMPFTEDGTPVDVVLNPLGVPSRMNIGQVLETILGGVGSKLGVKFANPVFNGLSYDEVKEYLKKSGLNETGREVLYDGMTGEVFQNPVTVGVMYYLKLSHLVDDKVHARSTGPYSLVTQQPLGGKAQFGGQRVGEMEVWAIEAYGASSILQEFLTVKADAMEGRTRIYESIVRGDHVAIPSIPESFNVLVQELRGLGLNIEIFDKDDNEINIMPIKKDIIRRTI